MPIIGKVQKEEEREKGKIEKSTYITVLGFSSHAVMLASEGPQGAHWEVPRYPRWGMEPLHAVEKDTSFTLVSYSFSGTNSPIQGFDVN